MKRAIAVFLFSSAASLLFTVANPAQGQTVDTQVTLSCNDGHSVIFEVDQTTLTSLLADVQAINASGTGTSCTLTMAAIDPSSETAKWTVYDYNPSNQALAPRNSPNSMPATTSGSMTTFQFKPDIYTALLTTTDKSLTGDLSSKTLSATVESRAARARSNTGTAAAAPQTRPSCGSSSCHRKRPVRPALLVALRCRPIPASTRSSGGRTQST